MILSKGNRLYSIIFQKCPRCHEGDLYISKPYNLKKFDKMPEKCPVCNIRFEKEPGFFYGAMYVSYAIQVALFISVLVAFQILAPDVDILYYIIVTISLVVILLPLTYRISRAIWINFFFDYQPPVKETKDITMNDGER